MQRLTVGLIAAALLGAVLATACTSSDSERVEALAAETAILLEATQRAHLIAALEPLDPLRYHHLDAVIRNDGRIPADAVIWATRAREVLAWADWPIELKPHHEQYKEWLDALLAAFRADDAAAAAEPSRIVHALAHTFEAALEQWLSNEPVSPPPALAGLEPPAHEHEAHGDH